MNTIRDINQKNIQNLECFINKSEEIILVTHIHPDGDALGSTIGMAVYLQSRGKKATIILPDKWPATLEFIFEGFNKENIIVFENEQARAKELLAKCDLLICQDLNSFSRTEQMQETLRSIKCAKVLIDHHQKPEIQDFDLVFSEINISSASELVFYIFMAMEDINSDAARLPKAAGRALLTGMTTDTNNFGNSTFPSTFNLAASLIAAGYDRDEIVSHINNEHREERVRLLGRLLDSRLTITDRGVAYMIIDKKLQDEFNIQEGDTEGFVNIPLTVKKVVMSILLKEDEGKYRVSTRSKEGYSARILNELYFNGGGHERASGGKLLFETAATTEAAAEYIEKVTEKFFADNE